MNQMSVLQIIYYSTPFITLLIMAVVWFKKGRDPKDIDNIVPFYQIPNNISPVEAGVLVDNRIDDNDISAQIIYCIQQGYLNIEYSETYGYILTKTDKSGSLRKKDPSKVLIESLFDDDKEFIDVTDLSIEYASNATRFSDFVYSASQSLYEKGLYKNNPQDTISNYRFISVGLLASGFILLIISMNNNDLLKYIFPLFYSGLFVAIIAPKMSVRTEKGATMRNAVFGFKEYLSAAEKERVEFHNKPEKDTNTFTKLLPFAVALGLEGKWSNLIDRGGEGAKWKHIEPESDLSIFEQFNNMLKEDKNGR